MARARPHFMRRSIGSRWSFRKFSSSAARGSLKTGTSPQQAAFRRASIWRCAWSSAITGAKSQQTAYTMEYQGQGWMDPDSNQVYAVAPVSTAEHLLCPVCGMDVDPASAPKSVFKGKTYYFCSDDDKKTFDAAPDKFVTADKKL